MKPDVAQRLYDALRRIASYAPPDRIRRDNERGRGTGLDTDEEIEMAYENVITEAKMAIKGVRRPIVKTETCGGSR